MSATVVVGGQYGSEGKGKVVALLAKDAHAPWLVRCGGPNSGHTVTIDGKSTILRQIPSCSEPSAATFCISAGCAVDQDILLKELALLGIDRGRIIVDPRAVLISEEDRHLEADSLKYISSTCSGTGGALLRRAARKPGVKLVKDSKELRERCRVETVAGLLHDVIKNGGEVIIEGTQGFGLSLFHGFDYPYVTSRDTTAGAFISECGLSLGHIGNIIMVLRTFPIRVAGTSGPFAKEISWDEVRAQSGAPKEIEEFTSVTGRLRRVARFDLEAVKAACRYNTPTSLAVMGMDRLDYLNTGVTNIERLTENAKHFIDDLELATGIQVEFVGTGFDTFDSFRIPIHARFSTIEHH